MNKTLIITTGGTIESFYDRVDDTPAIVPQHAESIIPAALDKLRQEGRIDAGKQFDFYPLGQHDSKHVTPEMIRHIAYYLHEHPEYGQAVIVHGTDTMPIHGRLMEQYMAEFGVEDRKVVFTGAMEPLRDKQKAWRESDGWDNLAFALNEITDAPRGVSMVMKPGTWMDVEYFNKYVQTAEQTPGSKNLIVTESGFIHRDKKSANTRLTTL